MNKKIILSFIITTLFGSSLMATGIPVVDAAGLASNQAIAAAKEIFDKALAEASLTEGITTGNASIKGQQAYDATLNEATKYGGAYGKDAANIMTNCFDIKLPSFSGGLGIKGLDMCGLDSLDNMRKTYLKGKSSSLDQQTLNKFKEKTETKPDTKITPKASGKRLDNCDPRSPKCQEYQQKLIEREIKTGNGGGGASSSPAIKKFARDIATSNGEEKDANGTYKNQLCTQNELQGPTTKDLSCTEDAVTTIIETEKEKTAIPANSSRLLNIAKNKIPLEMEKTIENRVQDLTDRQNNYRDIRDEYNKKFNPNKFVIEDPKLLGGDSTYKRLEASNQLTLEPTMYIVPQVKDDKFTFGKYGIDNYNEAMSDFGSITLTDTEGNVKAGGDKETIQKTINRLGGVTPFSSALYGYESINSVMAKNIYSNGEENGELGREMAIINGLKGNMYQTLMLNQQLENQMRTNYNIRIKEFDKISSDNDMINNNLEIIQNQNTMIIKLLEELNSNISKLR